MTIAIETDVRPRLLRRSVLSRAELLAMRLAAAGYSEKETALMLNKSSNTVRVQVENAKRKLNAVNKVHAVVILIATGILDARDALSISEAA